MAAPAQPAPNFGLRAAHQALLVIHGIGEQNPYETLDSFARGIFTHFRDNLHLNAKLCPIEFAHKDWTQVGIRVGIFPPGPLPDCGDKDAPPPQPAQPQTCVDIFEYYWAPETEDKLSAVDTVKWVLFTDLTPLKYFADNLQQMICAQGISKMRAVGKALKLYARELVRVFVIYLFLGGAMALLLAWLSQNHEWGPALQKLFTALKPQPGSPIGWNLVLVLLFYALFLLMGWFGLQAIAELKSHPGKAIETIGDGVWLACNIVLAAAFLAVALYIDLHKHIFAVWHVLRIIGRHGNWEPLFAAALAAIVSYAMTAYVADVAVYTNMDAKSKSYVTRNAILDGSTAALKMLLTSPNYDRVILAGHSLGSVIAYDTINDLLSERNATPLAPPDTPDPYLALPQLQKLTGLVTFGCPLDKIYYFFREHVKRDQAIRAQILSMLHSFRKKPSGRDYGEFTFNYRFGQLDDLIWLNAWAKMDFVSADLQFYFVDNQREFPYAVPALAHLSYWGDPNFYEYFCGRLL